MVLYVMECNIGIYKSAVSSLGSLSCSARLYSFQGPIYYSIASFVYVHVYRSIYGIVCNGV